MTELLLGASLAAAAFPQVWMAIEAAIDLGGRTPSGMHMLDYETHGWSRYAFVLSHLWLGWVARAREGPSAGLRTGLVVVVGLEITVVWAVAGWLALRGWGRVLF